MVTVPSQTEIVPRVARGGDSPADMREVLQVDGKMAHADIPDDVRRFLISAIDSVPHLEALLLLHASPEVHWSVDDVARRLYVNPSLASSLLTRLVDLGFLCKSAEAPERFWYQPDSSALMEMADKLATAYASALIPITMLIHSKSRVQQFADSFRLRKG